MNEDVLVEGVIDLVNHYSKMFDELALHRHNAGAKEYGPLTFLENDVIAMMCEELADLANYARMQFIKLLIIQEQLKASLPQEGKDFNIGSFKGAKDGWNR